MMAPLPALFARTGDFRKKAQARAPPQVWCVYNLSLKLKISDEAVCHDLLIGEVVDSNNPYDDTQLLNILTL